MHTPVPGTGSRSTPARRHTKRQAPAAKPKAHGSARSISTQDLIARIWDSLRWHKTLQAAFLIIVAGVTAALLMAELEITAHLLTGQAAAWPVSITITATVSYQAARRRRR